MTESENLEEQKYELLALQEICGENHLTIYSRKLEQYFDDELKVEQNVEFFKKFDSVDESKIGGILNVEPTIIDTLIIEWSDG